MFNVIVLAQLVCYFRNLWTIFSSNEIQIIKNYLTKGFSSFSGLIALHDHAIPSLYFTRFGTQYFAKYTGKKKLSKSRIFPSNLLFI